MTITESSKSVAVQWRAFVGPTYRRLDALDYYDWPALTLGAYTPTPADTTVSTIDLEPAGGGSTYVNLTDATDYPAAGGVWVGPGAVGETWEYVPYYEITGGALHIGTLPREAISAEQTGHHTVGAPVKFWWPLTLDAPPDFTSQTGNKLADKYWSAKLKGGQYPQAALRSRQLCIVQARWAEGTGTWGAWQTELIGWLLNPHVKDSAQEPGTWDSDYVSSRQMLDLTFVGGLRVGEQDIAISGTASASPQLADPSKETGTGEFISAAPDVSAKSAIDGDMDTLYISERYLGAYNRPPGSVITDEWYQYGIDQVSISPPVGRGKGGRWISMVGQDGFAPPWLINADKVYPDFNSDHLITHNMIVCENEVAFRAANTDFDKDCTIVELNQYTAPQMKHLTDAGWLTLGNNEASAVTIPEWWDSFDPAGSAIALVAAGQLYGMVVWGTETIADLVASHSWPSYPWTGVSVDAPLPGETIRRNWNYTKTTAGNGWQVGPVSTPGYWMQGTGGYWAWLYHDTLVAPMGLTLRDDIDDTQTTGIYITSVAGDTLDGLPDAGEIQIRNEKITYTAKPATNDYLAGTVTRHTSSTTAALHHAGDTIYVVESGVATDARLIAAIHAKRKTGRPVPAHLKLFASSALSPRTTDGAYWLVDYTQLVEVSGNTLEDYVWTLTPPVRYRHIMFAADTMSVDPYRLMLNEITLIPDLSLYSAAHTLTTGTIADAQTVLLGVAGLDSSAITDNGDTPTVVDYTTDSGMCGSICADLADYGGCRFEVGRDSKVTLRLDPYWSGGSFPAEVTDWIPALASSIDGDFKHGLSVGQVLLTWRNADNSDHGTVRYPPTKDALGAVVPMGPYVYADSTAALAGATKRYWQARRPNGMLIEAAGTAWAHDAGEVCGLLRTPSAGNILDRTYMVQQARHLGQESALTVLQISGVGE